MKNNTIKEQEAFENLKKSIKMYSKFCNKNNKYDNYFKIVRDLEEILKVKTHGTYMTAGDVINLFNEMKDSESILKNKKITEDQANEILDELYSDEENNTKETIEEKLLEIFEEE